MTADAAPWEQAHPRLARRYAMTAGRRAITAAGRRITAETPRPFRNPDQAAWQTNAWRYRDSVPELGFVCRYQQTGMDRARLYAAEVPQRGADPIPLGPDDDGQYTSDIPPAVQRLAAEAMALLDAAGIWGRMAENLQVAGECYLLGEGDPNADDRWSVRSTLEINHSGDGRIKLMDPLNQSAQRELELKGVDLLRLWLPHPVYYDWPDSPLRGGLQGSCEELVLLGRLLRAHVRSRISSNSMAYIPDELTLTRPGQAPVSAELPEADEGDGDDPFMDELIAAWTTPIGDETDVSSIVPVVMRGPAMIGDKLMKDAIGVVEIGRQDIQSLLERETAAVTRLARGLDMPPEILLGMGEVNHWCVPGSYQVFTKGRGWVHHSTLTRGDLVMTLNHETGASEWQPVVDLATFEVANLEMVRTRNRYHDSLSTVEHKWPITDGGRRTWTTSDWLTPTDRITRAAPHASLPTVAKYEDAFVELVAWFVTEGTCTWPKAGHCQVRIGQSHQANPAHVARIRQTLTTLYGPASATLARPKGTPRGADVPARWREHREARGMTLFHLNKPAFGPLLDVMESWRSKVARRDFVLALTAAQLELFLTAVAMGDGDTRTAWRGVDQRDPARLAPIELAAILAGHPVRTTTRESGGFGRATQHYLSIGAAHHTTPAGTTTRETYTGTVWCPVTANHTWLAKSDTGHVFYTGNTGWLVSENSIRYYFAPRAKAVCTSLTTAYLRPYLLAAGVDPAIARRVIAWFDLSELTQAVDRAADGRDGHKSSVLSDAALREVLGFGEDDAPNAVELLRRAALGGASPASLMIAARLFEADDLPADLRAVIDQAVEASRPAPAVQVGPGGPLGDPRQAQPGNAQPDQPLPVRAALEPAAAVVLASDLAAVDLLAWTELGAALEAVAARAIDRAQSRARSRANRSATLAALVRGVDEVCARLGEDGLRTLELADESGGAGLLDQLADWVRCVWRTATRTAAERLGAAAATLAGVRSGRELTERVLARIPVGEEWLVRALTRHLRARLLAGEPGTTRGEPVGLVPVSLIRGALSWLAGADDQQSGPDDQGLPVERGRPLPTLATGQYSTDWLAGHGVRQVGVRWQYYGPLRHQPFEPHEVLHGVEAGGVRDNAWRTLPGDEWIGDYYHPGDHTGCRCMWVPLLARVDTRAVAASGGGA